MEDILIRPAVVADVMPILDLVNGLAADQVMLPRSPASVIERVRDFMVAEVGGEFAGCGALAIVWSDMAEVRSIAVDPKFQKLGLGKQLARALIANAEELGLPKVMAFTYVSGFFESLGFEVVEHASLPHKVFNDCLNCPKFHCCDETAVLLTLHETPSPPGRGPMSLPLPGAALPRPVGAPKAPAADPGS